MTIEADRPLRFPPVRTLDGLRVEYEIALREGKGAIMKIARSKARALAMATGQVVPDWAAGWGP